MTTSPATLETRSVQSSVANPPPDSSAESESWRERLDAALPLLLLGVLCIGVAVFLYEAGSVSNIGVNGAVHLRPWVLLVALGVTAISGGIVALLADSALSAPKSARAGTAPSRRGAKARARPATPVAVPQGRYPGPTSQELATLSDRVAQAESPGKVNVTPRPSPALARSGTSAREWDEASIGPVARTASQKEEWDESPEAFEAAASAPAPPDVVLRQLDELEASLRKKRVISGSD